MPKGLTSLKNEPALNKTNKMACVPSEDSDQSLLCVQWVAKDLSFLHADSEDSDQTGHPDAPGNLSFRSVHMSFFLFCRALAQLYDN